mgnify:CR=1 FL=1
MKFKDAMGESFVPRPPFVPRAEEKDEENELGAVHIHNSVIGVIARLAAAKVPGVVDFVGGLVDGLAGIVGKRSSDRGVHVEVVDNGVVIELNVVLEYGVHIPKVAWQIQNEARKAVEQMTGKSVKAVNVVVQSVQAPAPTSGGPQKRGEPAHEDTA